MLFQFSPSVRKDKNEHSDRIRVSQLGFNSVPRLGRIKTRGRVVPVGRLVRFQFSPSVRKDKNQKRHTYGTTQEVSFNSVPRLGRIKTICCRQESW